MHLSRPIECTTPRVSPNVNYRLWVIILYQGRFITCNKCTILGKNIDNDPRSWGAHIQMRETESKEDKQMKPALCQVGVGNMEKNKTGNCGFLLCIFTCHTQV